MPAARPFPLGKGVLEITYDHEGREVSPGNRGASFASIGEGPHAVVYRARTPQGDVALKVQKEKAPRTNDRAQDRWRREYDHLVRFGGESPGLAGLVEVPGFEEREGPPNFEPLFLCREVGALFHLPCPKCMRIHTLADCRRDDILGWAGLPTYGSSSERFLWCEACGPEEPVFYARKERRGPMPVKDFVSLIREMRSVVDRGADETPLAGELLEGLKAAFPCATCPHRAACYPRDAQTRGLAEARVVPFSMNEFHAWPLPLLPLTFEEACDALGGATAADLSKLYGKAWASPAIRRMKEEAIALLRPQDATRALAAKVDLFAQLVQAVHRLHAQTSRPHLNLSPAHALVDIDGEGSLTVHLVAPGGPEPRNDLCLPPPELRAPYAPAAQRDDTFGRTWPVRIHVDKVWSKGGQETFFSARVHGEGIPSQRVSDKDEVRLVFNLPGWTGREVRGRPMVSEETSGGSGVLGVVTEPMELTESLVNDLKSSKGRAPIFGTASLFRNFGIPFDIHALGMLLFRALLANERQSFERVIDELVAPVSASIELGARTRPEAGLEAFRALLAEELGREPGSRLGGPANVWFKPAEAAGANLPADIWLRLLAIGFQAVTHVKGFSFCDSDRDDAGGDAGAPTLSMLGQLSDASAALATALKGTTDAEPSVYEAQPLGPDDADSEAMVATPELAGHIADLEARLEEAVRSRDGLLEAWNRVYEGVVGIEDRAGPPTDPSDGRIALVAATAAESIECILQVFKGVAAIGGDEVGETVPKIRMMIQDAIFATLKGESASDRLDKITRQFRAFRMFLFAVVQTFLEAHADSTKLGTKKLLDTIEQKLFEPVVEGKRERPAKVDELRQRFAQIRELVEEKHKKVFQPFFQDSVRQRLSKL
ncbi:MAG: hypothetical protein MUE73_03595 [Planctomycetes bacterium]|nr:hypothetical protein [Planctomycetota bacterium]